MMELVLAVGEFWRRATPRVLIVSAGKAQADNVRAAVQSAGYSIGGVADDVRSALEAMSRQRFDAVVIGDRDLHCPELAQSTLGQGIPIALIGVDLDGSRPEKTARAQVVH